MSEAVFEGMIAFISKNLNILLHFALLALVTWLLFVLIGVVSQRWKKWILNSRTEADRQARMLTMENVTITSLKGVILAIAAITFLGILGFNLAPLLASAGIAGLAISLGAQTLIKDFLTGILIVSENQFGVGDQVEIGSISGVVESITLRTVSVRGHNGSLNIIPNGDIRQVANFSRDWSRAAVDLIVPLSADLNDVNLVLSEAAALVKRDESIRELLLETPQVICYHQLSGAGMQVRLTARVQAGQNLVVERALRRYALEKLQNRGIELAVPIQEIIVKEQVDKQEAGPN